MAVNYNSNFDETIPFTDASVQINLATSTAQAITVPGDSSQKFQALFGYNDTSNVYVRLNGTATVPGAGLNTAVSNLEFKPGYDGSKRNVKGGDTLSFITPDSSGAYVGVTFRQLPS